jgi:hypothetical protein
VARRVRTIAKVAFVLMVVGVVAAILVGPGIAIGWVGAYLFPVVAVLGVMFGAFGLLMWGSSNSTGGGTRFTRRSSQNLHSPHSSGELGPSLVVIRAC